MTLLTRWRHRRDSRYGKIEAQRMERIRRREVHTSTMPETRSTMLIPPGTKSPPPVRAKTGPAAVVVVDALVVVVVVVGSLRENFTNC